MKYTVTINEESRSITATLADGTKGVARCCPTDRFDLTVGTELALERARVASKAKTATPKSVMELVRELEKALPEGEMVVVGNGEKMTEKQKEWLATLAGVPTKPCCPYSEDGACGYDKGYSDGYDKGYGDGYEDGYADAMDEAEDDCDSPTDPTDSATDSAESELAMALRLAILHPLGLI